MQAWLRTQRHWLVTARLPAYAPDLDPVEALRSNLKAVEFANLTSPTLAEVIAQAHRGSNECATRRTWPTRSCGTPACRLHDVSYQPPQRRFLRRAGVLVVLVALVVAVLVALRAGHHYQQGVAGECALRFEADKTRLDDDRHHWGWWPPRWVCAFEQDGRRWERHPW